MIEKTKIKGYMLINKDGTLIKNRYNRYEIEPEDITDFDKCMAGGTCQDVELKKVIVTLEK